jgi:Type I phosphodiesterase / nucleotide pyrophosphatase
MTHGLVCILVSLNVLSLSLASIQGQSIYCCILNLSAKFSCYAVPSFECQEVLASLGVVNLFMPDAGLQHAAQTVESWHIVQLVAVQQLALCTTSADTSCYIGYTTCKHTPCRDLHTVDDGILSQLPTELAADDWSVLVVHFLGVDHVGHTYGPATQAMSDKLDQMNTALQSIFAAADAAANTANTASSSTDNSSSSGETLVLVMGDHGMTADGNHGGATLAETGAALLVYAPHNQHFLHLAETGPETEPKSDSPLQNFTETGSKTGSFRGVLSWAAESEALFSDATVDSGTAAERSTRKVAQVCSCVLCIALRYHVCALVCIVTVCALIECTIDPNSTIARSCVA